MQGSTASLSKAYEQTRYSVPHHILRSEAIYGHGFQSPGGLEGFKTTLLDRMPVSEGMNVLEIGSGLGGAAFFLAESVGVRVTGVDLSEVMVSIASERRGETRAGDGVRFVHGDVRGLSPADGAYDLIYSKDTLMYEPDKAGVFRHCFDLLVSGGHICLSDFCRGESSEDFEHYVEVSGYHLRSIPDYARTLSDAGFELLVGENTSALARGYLEKDLAHYRQRVESGAEAVSKEDADHIVARWLRKIDFSRCGNLLQGLFIARKP